MGYGMSPPYNLLPMTYDLLRRYALCGERSEPKRTTDYELLTVRSFTTILIVLTFQSAKKNKFPAV